MKAAAETDALLDMVWRLLCMRSVGDHVFAWQSERREIGRERRLPRKKNETSGIDLFL